MEKLIPKPLNFWATKSGVEPVRVFLSELDKADKRKIGLDLRTVQFGWPIGMPLVRPLGQGLHELRTSLPSKRELRLFFAANEESITLVHAFIKKTQKTPDHELKIARSRLKEQK